MAWRSIFGGRALRLAFLFSLALNFFFAGAAVALFLFRPPPPPPPFGPPERMIEHLADELSDQGKSVFLATFIEHQAEIDARHEKMEASREQARALFGAEKIDPMELNAARASARQSLFGFMQEMDAFLVDVAQRLGPEDRERLLRAFPPPPPPPPGEMPR